MSQQHRQAVPNLFYIKQLRGGNNKAFLVVKVLRTWKLPFSAFGEIQKMILADEKGTKIDATIPVRTYKNLETTDIQEGEWYIIRNFRVHRSIDTEKYADNDFKITFIYESNMYPAPITGLPQSHFFDFVHFSSIFFQIAKKSVCHDAFGIVVKVGNVERLDHVANQNDADPESRFLQLQLKDWRGFYMKSVVIGVHCDRFISLWRNLGYDCGYKWLHGIDPVLCVLRFFRFSQFRGQTCLISNNEASQMFLNENFFLANEIEAYINGFLYNVQADEM